MINLSSAQGLDCPICEWEYVDAVENEGSDPDDGYEPETVDLAYDEDEGLYAECSECGSHWAVHEIRIDGSGNVIEWSAEFADSDDFSEAIKDAINGVYSQT